ncbi:hypothetical protein AVEN_270317-1 [Araneus ventricosus]|uniref:Uncharacterized protein n=1 Tax=Araneus ventricosus TaxID=182803 RepID=A0A4Y2QQ48_ARAVE|nr:hypothetical protein AVEN_237269-1 [Araneus ventricosus]GBN65492.1 hypothetical protein AVEN_270317-1 [Araneus ventricosus]
MRTPTYSDFLHSERRNRCKRGFRHSRVYTGRISAFTAWQWKWSGWISGLDGYPNIGAHRSNSDTFFALTTDFGLELSNLRGVERS